MTSQVCSIHIMPTVGLGVLHGRSGGTSEKGFSIPPIVV
jgi:hypothetical protein